MFEKPEDLPGPFSYATTGFPSHSEDYREGPLSLDRHLIRRPAATFFFRAAEDSAELGLVAGDLLVVDRSLSPRDGSIALAVAEGEFVLIRMRRSPRSGQMEPEGLPADPFFSFELWGVAAYVIRSL